MRVGSRDASALLSHSILTILQPSLITVVLVAFVAGACGPTLGSASACADAEQQIDTRSFHVIDASEATFEIHPPSSGPHTSYLPEDGLHDEPVAEAVQVAALEHGMVVVNFLPGVSAEQSEVLAQHARTRDVVVTPAPDGIDGDANVALTAWGVRRLCDSLSLVDARSFVREHAGRGAPH